MPRFAFNEQLWKYGQEIEDRVMPVVNDLFEILKRMKTISLII